MAVQSARLIGAKKPALFPKSQSTESRITDDDGNDSAFSAVDGRPNSLWKLWVGIFSGSFGLSLLVNIVQTRKDDVKFHRKLEQFILLLAMQKCTCLIKY